MILCQQGAGPNICSELVLGNADLAVLKVVRRLYPVLANINRGVTKRAGHKGWHSDVGRRARCRQDGEARERQLADIEFGMTECPEEDLFRAQRHDYGGDTIDLNAAIEQGPGAIVVTDCKR
jgi:hypothetical protein